jgi:hypothetical protein
LEKAFNVLESKTGVHPSFLFQKDMGMPERSHEDKMLDARNRERMLQEFRAAHHPEREGPPLVSREEGPPVPDVTIESIVAMPHDTEEQKVIRLAAAERWLKQLMTRARWVCGKQDLRTDARVISQLADVLGIARRVLPVATIQAALEKPPASPTP